MGRVKSKPIGSWGLVLFWWCLVIFELAPVGQVMAQGVDQENGSFGSRPLLQTEMQQLLEHLDTVTAGDQVRENRQKLKRYITGIEEAIARLEKEISQLDTALDGLGELGGEASPGPSGGPPELLALKKEKELQLAELRLLQISAEETINRLDLIIQGQQREHLFYRGKPLWHLFASGQDRLPAPALSHGPIRDPGGISLLLAVPLLFLAIFAGTRSGRRYLRDTLASDNSIVFLAEFFADKSSLLRLAYVLLGVGSLLVALSYSAFHEYLAVSAAILFLFFWAAFYVLLHGMSSRWRRSTGAEEQQSQGDVLQHLLSLFTALTITLNSPYLLDLISDRWLAERWVESAAFLCLASWLVLTWLFCRSRLRPAWPQTWKYLGPVLGLLLGMLLGLEILGYRNLTYQLLYDLVVSLVILGVAVLVYDSVDIILSIGRRFKDRLVGLAGISGLETGEESKAFGVLGIGLKICVALAALVFLLHQWGATSGDNERLRRFLLDGVLIGGIGVSPARITLAFFVLVACWPAIGYLKLFIERRWLESAGLSRSSRDTIVTLSGYVASGLLIILVLGMAGVRMTGLTVIVGALSVGIGFGLQNIVNNFISGLILMFERPIKKGDWIQVGTTEGYVKKISIRSTIVQTFDRSDVIVPNSELIANQVTNMMFDDQRGRVRISVGVAYGSDTALVQRLLLEAAAAHDQVISDSSAPEPRAYFQAFGDSSLNFDLLCHIRDVDMKLRVRSELHLAIDRAFRENQVEIPFPQRDVHLKQP